jgi:hypothetical protein
VRFIKHALYILFICCLLSFIPYNVEGSGVGTSGNTMLKIGVGARSTGMGEATVAATDDVTSIYWNPAGLVQVRSAQFSAMHIEWFDDVRYEWLGFAQPFSSRVTVAADISYLYMGSIPRTIESASEEYEEDGTFSPVDIAGRLALSVEALKGLLVGASFQRIQSQVGFDKFTKVKISDKTAQSMAIDVGGIYYVPRVPGLSVGGCLQNLGNQTKGYISKKEAMPFALNLGMAYKTQMMTKKTLANEKDNTVNTDNTEKQPATKDPLSALTIAFAVIFPSDDTINAHLGLEYRFSNGIAFRGGYRTGTSFAFPSGISGGMGYDSSSYQVDYAFVPYGDLGNTHRVSFTIHF